MASTMSFPLTAGTEVLGLNGDEGRPVFEYVDGKRTYNQRRDALGRPVFRHKALIRYTADAAEEVALVTDSAAPLGVLKPVQALAWRPETWSGGARIAHVRQAPGCVGLGGTS